MDQLPDLETISTLLTVVEGRDQETTSVTRYDDDHAVLLNTQAELVDVLTQDLPADFDQEALRRLLQRIDEAIENNRTRRGAAMARETATGSR